jgi:protein arginine N-methyltransferase 5
LPYVVKIYNATYPCGLKTQEVFTFRHLPYPDDPIMSDLDQNETSHLKNHSRKTFTVVEQQCQIHGFAGYFTAELYQDWFYSTNPPTHTPGMHSWFPLYFPIKEPLLAYKDQEVTISIWRNHSATSVWYEWGVSIYDSKEERVVSQSYIHNSRGRGYSIGL